MASSSTTLSPLRYRFFLLILVGSLLSNFGNAIQSTGAAWQLTSTHQPADIVALVQSAFNLPIMLLALPAGAWADMHDKRGVMLMAQCAMLLLSLLLAVLSFQGINSPAVIIGITALLACGVACFNPALSASIGGIVPRAELAAAVALNILAFNVARSLGPALGGAIVAAGGAKAAFVTNALSYLAVIVILWRWRPEIAPRPERRPLLKVVGEGVRYAMGSREIRAIMVRAISFTLTGSAAWALMPLVAADLLHQGSVTFGLLLGALGLGAVIGAASATWFRTRFSSEAIIRAAGIAASASPSRRLCRSCWRLLVVSGAGLGTGIVRLLGRGTALGAARHRRAYHGDGQQPHLWRHRARQLALGPFRSES